MKKLMQWIAATVIIGSVITFPARAAESASVLLQKGVFAEETEGDLKAAIALYRQVRADEKFSRSVAAQAQFRLAVCLQKQGDKKEAVAAFRELIAQFPSQEELLVRARKELASLGAAVSEIKVRKVMIQGVPAYENAVETRLGRIAPDARHFSFTDWGTLDGYSWLRVRNLQTGDTMDLTDPKPGKTGHPWNSTWSPDGKSLAFIWINTRENNANGDEVRIARLDGSEPRAVIKLDRGQEYTMRLLDWSTDGQFILVQHRNKGLMEITLSDNSQRLIKPLEFPGEDDLLQPTARYSPDGRYVAYDYAPDPKDLFQRDIYLISKDGSSESVIVNHPAHDYGPSWTPDGKAIVFASNRTGANGIWLVPVENGRTHGSPTLIHQTMGRIHPKGFAKDGLFYYDVHLGDSDLFVVKVDPQTSKVTSEPARLNVPYEGWVSSPSWSPNGEHIAFIARPNFTRGALDTYSRTLLCIHSVKTGQTRELATPHELKISGQTQWSPDSRELLVGANNSLEKSSGFYRINALTGDTKVIFKAASTNESIFGPVWSHDGKSVIFTQSIEGRKPFPQSIAMRNLETANEKQLKYGLEWSGALAVSPDGLELAVRGWPPPEKEGELRRQSLLVLPLEKGGPRELIVFPNTASPYVYPTSVGTIRWAPDGRHILFVKRQHVSGAVRAVLCQVDAKGGAHTELGIVPGSTFSVHPDGRKIVFQGGGRHSELWAVEGLDVPDAVLQQQAKARETAPVK